MIGFSAVPRSVEEIAKIIDPNLRKGFDFDSPATNCFEDARPPLPFEHTIEFEYVPVEHQFKSFTFCMPEREIDFKFHQSNLTGVIDLTNIDAKDIRVVSIPEVSITELESI